MSKNFEFKNKELNASPITFSKSQKRGRESSNLVRNDSSKRAANNNSSSNEIICLDNDSSGELNFLNDDVDHKMLNVTRKKINLTCFNCLLPICEYTIESNSDVISDLDDYLRKNLNLTYNSLSIIDDPVDQSFFEVNTLPKSLNGFLYMNCKNCSSLIGLKPVYTNNTNNSFLTNYIDKILVLNL